MDALDLIDIRRRKLVVKKAEELMTLLDCDYKQNDVEELINYNNSIIDKYNRVNHVVVNPTKVELGRFNGFCKKTIKPHYKDNLDNLDIDELIKKTKFSDELRNMYIAMDRFYPYWYRKTDPLRAELRNTIQIDLIKEFNEQNEWNT